MTCFPTLSLRARPRGASLLLPWAALIGLGCSRTFPSPPSTLYLDETPRTVGAGTVELGTSAAAGGAVFEGAAVVGSASVSYGLTERLDLRGDVLGGVYFPPGESNARRALGTARIGVERALVSGVVSFVSGLGGGATTLGGYVAADAGFVVGYENRFCVPFLSAVGTASVPLTTPSLVVGTGSDAYVLRAHPSVGVLGSLGVDVPIGLRDGATTPRYAFRLAWDTGFLTWWDSADVEAQHLVYVAAHLSFRVALRGGTVPPP